MLEGTEQPRSHVYRAHRFASSTMRCSTSMRNHPGQRLPITLRGDAKNTSPVVKWPIHSRPIRQRVRRERRGGQE
ncbi:MAG: hypothetical protein BGO98_11230 [Myxococcales bacterium 68-20]|nr:MAG: hypothetical protein BGO98_11230 [Myxococcales bacterium 68-20]